MVIQQRAYASRKRSPVHLAYEQLRDRKVRLIHMVRVEARPSAPARLLTFSRWAKHLPSLSRGVMRTFTYVVAGALVAPAVAVAAPAPTEARFRQLIDTRLVALSRGDWPAYRSLLDARLVHISDLGERRSFQDMAKFVTDHAGRNVRHEVASLSVRVVGSLAIVDAEVREHMPDGEAAWRETDVFVLIGERWRYLSHHETAIPQSAVAMAVGDDRLDDYAGHYLSSAGTQDIITAVGGTLFGQSSPGETPTAFVHVGPSAFAVPGDPSLLTFVRDRGGRVTASLWHLASGQIAVSKRED